MHGCVVLPAMMMLTVLEDRMLLASQYEDLTALRELAAAFCAHNFSACTATDQYVDSVVNAHCS